MSNSSGTTAKINFAANSKDVFVTYPASKAVYGDANDIAYDLHFAASNGIFLSNQTISTSMTFPAGYDGISGKNATIASGVTVTIPSGATWTIV